MVQEKRTGGALGGRDTLASVQCVILAGGLATRLRPLTEKIPKSLLPVAGKPFVDYQLELLAQSGVTDVLLCIGYLGDHIRAHCGDGSRYGVRIAYSEDGPTLRGTGGSLRKASPLLGDQFFVTYGDSYLQCAYADIWRYFAARPERGLLTVYQNQNQFDRSNVVVDGPLVRAYDKAHPTPDMTAIDYGLSVFTRSALDFLPAVGPSDLGDLNQALVARRELLAYAVPTRFYEIGSAAGLQEFDGLVREGLVAQHVEARPLGRQGLAS